MKINLAKLLDGIDKDLAFEFFAIFSRFESSLLDCNCLADERPGQLAKVSKAKLAEQLPSDFFEKAKDSGQASTLIESPPKKLVITEDGQVSFGDAPPPLTNTGELLRAVWQVRNNLFHGNKLRHSNRERDSALMQQSLWVIGLVLGEHPAVNARFTEPQYYS
jgi:hypothetical protein